MDKYCKKCHKRISNPCCAMVVEKYIIKNKKPQGKWLQQNCEYYLERVIDNE